MKSRFFAFIVAIIILIPINTSFIFFATEEELVISADIPSSTAVFAGNCIKLSSLNGTDIYFTVDGTDPIKSNTRILYSEFDSDNNGTTSEKEKGLLDTDVSKVAPAMAQGLSSLSGEKLEHLLRELLTDYNNIAYKPTGSTVMPIPLTFDEANEVFCGDVQDMFVLAFYVIKKNFSGFFKKVSARFGLQNLGQMMMGEKPNTDTST